MRWFPGVLAVLVCFGFSTQLFAVDATGKDARKERLREKAAAKANLGGGGEKRLAGKAKLEGESKVGLQQKILEKFDANGNGKLDPDEQAAARKAAAEQRKNKKRNGAQDNAVQPVDIGNGNDGLNGQPVGGGAAGPRGDGRAKLLEKFDFNRDGRLSDQEMARAKEYMQRLSGPGQNGANLPGGFSGTQRFKQ